MEPINWHAMTPAQRDQLMVEKVLDYSLQGQVDIPRSSQSMDAAWLVLQEMVSRRKTDERTFELFASYLVDSAAEQIGESEYIATAWGDVILAAQWTPETICVATLRALGYEVVIEEVKAR